MQQICFSSLCKVCPSVVLLWKRGGVSRKIRCYLTSVDRTSHLNGFVSDREREEKHSNEVAFGSAKALQDFLCFRTKIQYKYKLTYQQLQQFFPFEGVTDSSWVTAPLIFRLERPHKKEDARRTCSIRMLLCRLKSLGNRGWLWGVAWGCHTV